MERNRSCPAVSHCSRSRLVSTCLNQEARTNNLQLDSLPVHLDRLDAEVDAERGDEPWYVLIFVVPV